MTKLEFVQRVGKYNKKQVRDAKVSFWTGVILVFCWLLSMFIPTITDFWNDFMGPLSFGLFPIFAGLCFGHSIHVRRGTEEQLLLSNALKLIYLKADD
ncbi:hypothetical protein [Glaciecola sp. MF2-115]|uniref:hypothetical protein n=1 Tax=Glaciecola sp. MF2-115 TaxID=3384827 RepID=UPI0039A0172F